MSAFGSETSWLAIRQSDPALVRAAFGIGSMERVAFEEGLERAKRGGGVVFVAPAVEAWTLIVIELPVTELVALAEQASRSLDEVQAFACRAGARHYAWFRSRNGERERAFEKRGGRVLRDEGEPQRGEPADLDQLAETGVLELAGSWSVDPSTLARKRIGETGWLGQLERAPSLGPSCSEVIRGVVGAFGLLLVEVAAILALGRLFGRTELWTFGAGAGLALIVVAATSREGWKPKRILLLVGVALALGAVLGGVFPYRAD